MNIITRGFVEFIAFIFGISLSFYLEDIGQENNLSELNHQILERMNETINDDIKYFKILCFASISTQDVYIPKKVLYISLHKRKNVDVNLAV